MSEEKTIAVYIASPYQLGDQAQNVRRQIDTAEQLRELGYLPIWPLSSHFWHMVYPHAKDYWLEIDFEIVERCDVLLRLPGESSGADMEVEVARENGIPIVYSIRELVKWSNLTTGN